MICENIRGKGCGAGDFESHEGNVVSLRKRATSVVRLGAGESITARGRVGAVWITMEGDDQDYAVRRGELVRFSGAGLLVVEGLADYNEAELTIARAS